MTIFQPILSILIPCYNYDCSELVSALYKQATTLRAREPLFDFELILADDASTNKQTIAANVAACTPPECRISQREKNVGRAKNRNAAFAESKGEWLLIIDCDAQVVTDDFIERYWNDRHKADVVCGMLLTPATAPRGHELRHRYELQAERRGLRSVENRTRHPFAHFTVFNALLHQPVIGASLFDERCDEYGFEDTLLGFRLQAAGASILHTDNALLHKGINSNKSFLENTEASLRLLHRLNEPLLRKTRVVKATEKARKWYLLPFIRLMFQMTHTLLKKNLLGHSPSLFLFNLYKLGYYANLPSKDKKRR